MNPDLFNMFAPSGDPYSMGMLFSQAAQDPERMIPYLAGMGIEPPSKEAIFSPQPSPFADMEFSSQNKPKGIPGIDGPVTNDTTPRFNSPVGDMGMWGSQEPPAPAPVVPPVAPPQAQTAPQPNPLAALLDPQAKAGFEAEINNANPLQKLRMEAPAAQPQPAANPLAVKPMSPTPQDHPFGDVFAAPTPPAAAPATQLPQIWDGPMPKSRDLAVFGRMEGGRDGYGTVVDAGKGREALGQYGILNTNLAEWGQKHIGRPVTKEEFLANPNLQDQIAGGEISRLRSLYGPEGAARAWLAGEGGMNTNRTDAFGTTPAAHAATYRRFAADLGAGGPTRSTDISGARKPVLPDEAPPADAGAALTKTGKSLADMLKGVASPTVPEPLMPRGSAPPPPQPRPISNDNPIGALLALAMSGKKDPVSVLRLQQALGGK